MLYVNHASFFNLLIFFFLASRTHQTGGAYVGNSICAVLVSRLWSIFHVSHPMLTDSPSAHSSEGSRLAQ